MNCVRRVIDEEEKKKAKNYEAVLKIACSIKLLIYIVRINGFFVLLSKTGKGKI